MTNIAIFASGSGSNAENIISYFRDNKYVCIKLIISNKVDAYVHERATKNSIESITFPKTDFTDGSKVLEYLSEKQIDFIVLAGFLLKIPEKIIEAYPKKIINIHPALLPHYGGKGMYGDNVHKAIISAKESESGITIHFVNEKYDEGDIIFQAKCEVIPTDTFSDVAEKVHALEYKYFPQVIESIIKMQQV